jgi:IclR family pca regulon transcriptional regulator
MPKGRACQQVPWHILAQSHLATWVAKSLGALVSRAFYSAKSGYLALVRACRPRGRGLIAPNAFALWHIRIWSGGPVELLPSVAWPANLWYTVVLISFAQRNPFFLYETIGMTSDNDRYYIEALGRGMRILEAFTERTPSLSLTEISSIVGLDKSTVFRFAYTLEKLGYLARDPETKRYRPGLRVLRLGFITLNSLGLRQIAQPYLKALSAQTGETTNMTIRDGDQVVYVARNRTQQIIGINLHLGSRLPAHCTSMGKAQLLDLSRDELGDILGEGPYPATGPHTITSLDALVAELEKVRQQGYAINDEELAAGLRSVAAPIRDSDGKIVAAINISVPSARVSRQELETELAPLVKSAAREICLALGADV